MKNLTILFFGSLMMFLGIVVEWLPVMSFILLPAAVASIFIGNMPLYIATVLCGVFAVLKAWAEFGK